MAKKKNIKKYQIAGQVTTPTNFVGDPNYDEYYQILQQLQMNNMTQIPMQQIPVNDPAYLNGQIPSVQPISNQTQNTVNNQLNLQKQGWNLDSDGQYRKNIITEDKRNLQLNPIFQALNPLLDITRLTANTITDIRNSNRERRDLINARFDDARYNVNEQGLNNVPVYFETGGNISSNKAKEMLRDGKVHGKKLTDKQKRYFGWIAGGRKQFGGLINETGYLPSYETSLNPFNIIPDNLITMNGVPQDLVAIPNVGDPVFMPANSGNYTFPNASYVTEVPTKQRRNYNVWSDEDAQPIDPRTLERMGTGKIPYHESVARFIGQGAPETFEESRGLGMTKFTPYQRPDGTYGVFETNPSLINPLDFRYNIQPGFPLDRINKSKYYARDPYHEYYRNEALFQTGGVNIPEVTDKGTGSVELERGEVFQDINGNIQKVKESEKLHEQGGSKQPTAFRVLEDTADKRKDLDSKLLKIKPDDAEAITGFRPKRSVSHSKLFELATDYWGKKLKKLQTTVDNNLNYVQKNYDVHAQNSLDENLKLLENFPTENDIFNSIFNHQEEVKQLNNISTGRKKQTGGQNSYWTPQTRFVPRQDPYDPNNLPFGYGDPNYIANLMQQFNSVTGFNYPTTPQGLVQMRQDQARNNPQFITHAGNLNYWNRNATTDKNYSDTRGKYDAIGVLKDPLSFSTKTERDNFLKERNAQPIDPNNPNSVYWIDPTTGRYIGANINSATKIEQINPVTSNITAEPVQIQPLSTANYTDTPVTNEVPGINITGQVSEGITPSRFNEPLRWFDVAGAIDRYLGSGRIPVDLEQLQRQPLRARELNPLPTLLQNQGDFNAALEQLPTSGVGFANQANLLANKYRINNEVLGNYANTNAQRRDVIDQYNDQNQFALDQVNLQLRDQFNNRVLQGREVQRQQRLAALDGLFSKLAQNRKLNREGDLMLQLTPYFDQFANFNGNVMDITNSFNNQFQGQYTAVPTVNSDGTTTVKTYDKDGNLVKTVVRDKSNRPI